MINVFPLEGEKQLDTSGVGPTETIRVTPVDTRIVSYRGAGMSSRR